MIGKHLVATFALILVLSSSPLFLSVTQGVERATGKNHVNCSTVSNCGNCVYYARCRQPELPYGLFDLQDKRNIINSYRPSQNCVAILDYGRDRGHAAYVEKVNGEFITLAEGNYKRNRCGKRSVRKSHYKIVGYWCPD